MGSQYATSICTLPLGVLKLLGTSPLGPANQPPQGVFQLVRELLGQLFLLASAFASTSLPSLPFGIENPRYTAAQCLSREQSMYNSTRPAVAVSSSMRPASRQNRDQKQCSSAAHLLNLSSANQQQTCSLQQDHPLRGGASTGYRPRSRQGHSARHTPACCLLTATEPVNQNILPSLSPARAAPRPTLSCP